MTTAQHRKAFVAAPCTTASAFLAAWAQNGVFPNWPMFGACVLLGVVVGFVVAGTREARPIPEVARSVAQYMAEERALERLDAKPLTPVERMAERAAARTKP